MNMIQNEMENHHEDYVHVFPPLAASAAARAQNVPGPSSPSSPTSPRVGSSGYQGVFTTRFLQSDWFNSAAMAAMAW